MKYEGTGALFHVILNAYCKSSSCLTLRIQFCSVFRSPTLFYPALKRIISLFLDIYPNLPLEYSFAPPVPFRPPITHLPWRDPLTPALQTDLMDFPGQPIFSPLNLTPVFVCLPPWQWQLCCFGGLNSSCKCYIMK